MKGKWHVLVVLILFLTMMTVAHGAVAKGGIDYSRLKEQSRVYPVTLTIGGMSFRGTLARMDRLSDKEIEEIIKEALKDAKLSESKLAEAQKAIERGAKAEELTKEDIDRVMNNLMKIAGVDNIVDLIKTVGGVEGQTFSDSLSGYAADEAKEKAMGWLLSQAAEGAGEAARPIIKLLDAAVISVDQYKRDQQKWKDRVDAANAQRMLNDFYYKVNELLDNRQSMRSRGWALHIEDSANRNFTFFTVEGNLQIWNVSLLLKKLDDGKNIGASGQYTGVVVITVEYEMSPFDQGFENWIINTRGMLEGMKDHFKGSAARQVGITGSNITYDPDDYDPTYIHRMLDKGNYSATFSVPVAKGQSVRTRLDFSGFSDLKEMTLRHKLTFNITSSGRVKYNTTHVVEYTTDNQETLTRHITDTTTITVGGKAQSGSSDTTQEEPWDSVVWEQWEKEKWLEIKFP